MARRTMLALACASLMATTVVADVNLKLCQAGCPPGYQRVSELTGCGFSCYTGMHPECLPEATYNMRLNKWIPPAAPSPSQKEAAKSRSCGGNTGKECPDISCAQGRAYVIGQNVMACSTAGSQMFAFGLSDTMSDAASAELYENDIVAYKAAACDAPGRFNKAALVALVNKRTDNVATAVAQAMTWYAQYACSCLLGNNVALSKVKGAVVSVAKSQAEGLKAAMQALVDCDGKPILAPGTANAYGTAVELAVINVSNRLISKNGAGVKYPGQWWWQSQGAQCTTVGKMQLSAALADAVSCSIARVYADAISAAPARTLVSVAFSGKVNDIVWASTCDLKY